MGVSSSAPVTATAGSRRDSMKVMRAQDDVVNRIMEESEKADMDMLEEEEGEEEVEEEDNRKQEEEAAERGRLGSAEGTTGAGTIDISSKRKLLTINQKLSFELDSVYMEAMVTKASNFEFPFENLVFEGGGIKGFAYCGACSILEEYGIMKQIKRLAGTSSGSLYAALLAIGYTSHEVAATITDEFANLFKPSRFGALSFLPNIFKSFGWNSFTPFYQWMGDRFAEKTGNPDITFYELYQEYGKELCVVVTNLNMMKEEYFHPKTTPDVPIRLAVRMSMTLPGLFQPIKFHHNGYENTYIDGAILCNYPIHAFDGWWLSMKPEDRFLKRLQPLSECMKLYSHAQRFGVPNNKTLGFKIYSDDQDELDKSQIEELTPLNSRTPVPDTKLGRKYKKRAKQEGKTVIEHKQIMNAVDAFLKTLEKHTTSEDGCVTKEELEKALSDEESFPKRYAERLFGENISNDDVFKAIDRNQNGKIQLDELLHFIERTGVNVASRMFGHRWAKVDNVWQFLVQLQKALLMNMMERTFRIQDLHRTVGLNTTYLNTTDFDIEQGDKDFLFEEGRRRTDAYLRHYVVTHRPRRKSTIPSIAESQEEEEEEAKLEEIEKREMKEDKEEGQVGVTPPHFGLDEVFDKDKH